MDKCKVYYYWARWCTPSLMQRLTFENTINELENEYSNVEFVTKEITEASPVVLNSLPQVIFQGAYDDELISDGHVLNIDQMREALGGLMD